jgi:hypothetical protein
LEYLVAYRAGGQRLRAGRPRADIESVVIPVLLAGFVFGLVVGKWWAVVGASIVGLAVGLTSEVEVSPLVLGVGYGFVSAFAIAMGVALRRAVSGRWHAPR